MERRGQQPLQFLWPTRIYFITTPAGTPTSWYAIPGNRENDTLSARLPSLIPDTHTLGFEPPSTPTSEDESSANEPPEFVSRPRDLSDDEEEYAQQRVPRKKGGYDSRIEQILYENQDLQILITDAGKNHESGGSYIAYMIRTGVIHRREKL